MWRQRCCCTSFQCSKSSWYIENVIRLASSEETGERAGVSECAGRGKRFCCMSQCSRNSWYIEIVLNQAGKRERKEDSSE